jgi:predicted transcriptional regulator
LGIKSPKTLRNHLNYLIEKGYVIEEKDKYILPEMENIYFLIPLKTL